MLKTDKASQIEHIFGTIFNHIKTKKYENIKFFPKLKYDKCLVSLKTNKQIRN